jgi:hypothetical protein
MSVSKNSRNKEKTKKEATEEEAELEKGKPRKATEEDFMKYKEVNTQVL